MNDEKREIAFWAVGDPVNLQYTDPDEAVEMYLDGLDDEWPETVELVGYSRMKVTSGSFDEWILENLLEHLDENYGGEDAEWTEPTDAMEEAAKTFVEAVVSEYVPWACEPVEKRTVDVSEWVLENRPDWLEEQEDG